MQVRTLLTLLILTLIAVTSLSALAATTYTNRWTDRPKLLDNYAIDVLVDGDTYQNNIYTVGRFFYSNGGVYIGVIFMHNSTGSKLADNYLYTSNNVSFSDAAVNIFNNRVYTVGYECNSINCVGVAKNYSISDLSSSNSYITYNVSKQVDTYFRGDCSDADGNVYIVGEWVNRTVSPPEHYIILLAVDASWNAKWIKTLSASYNLTGWDCIVGEDGHLYVTATEFQGSKYPLYLFLLKMRPDSGALENSVSIPLYNSQGYTHSTSLSYADIDASSNEIIVAFSYTDELPDPTNPTSGVAVAGFNFTPSLVWRKNITTSSEEVFEDVAADSNGNVIAVGYTNNNYGTGLSTSQYNAFIIVLNTTHGLSKAILSGDTQGQYSTIANAAFIDGSGNVYWAGYAGNDDTYMAYYDVTQDVQLQVKQPYLSPSNIKGSTIKLSEEIISKPVKISEKQLKETGLMKKYAKELKPGIGLEATPSGASSGIIVATSEAVGAPITPPEPIPEFIAGISIITVIVLLFVAFRVAKNT